MTQIYALLVGIDRYAAGRVPNLRGCVADVQGTYNLLTAQFAIPAAQIRLLTASRAGGEAPEQLPTRANIINAWRTHLGQAGPGDQVFVHYSGHGSQARSTDPNEPDGYDETIVAHDSRTPGVYDILDKELGLLVQEIEERGAQVAIVLDCCHAGSGTRVAWNEAWPAVRRCRPDDRLRPPESVLDGADASAAPRAPTPSGWLPLGNHILLAACRDEELSFEYRVPDTGQWQGAASYFFQRALSTASPGATWFDLHDFVQTRVAALYPLQSPQLEGPGQLHVFGVEAEAMRPYLLVTKVVADQLQVNGGAAIGLAPGARLTIYPPGATPDTPPLAGATVATVQADRAWARLDQPAAVEPACRAWVAAWPVGGPLRVVAVDDPAVTAALAARADGAPSGFVQAVSLEASQDANADDATQPDFRVTVQDGAYQIADAAGDLLTQITPIATAAGAEQVADMLEHLAIYRNVQMLHNPAPTSTLRGAVSLELATYRQSGADGRPLDPQPVRRSGNEAVVQAGDKLALTITNRTSIPIYLAAFDLDPAYAITRIYPTRAAYQKVAAHASVTVKLLERTLDAEAQSRHVRGIKVVATRSPASFDVLQMPRLNEGDFRSGPRAASDDPFAELLNLLRYRGARGSGFGGDHTPDNWTTADLKLTVLAGPRQRDLTPGRHTIPLDNRTGFTLRKPVSFTGEIIITSIDRTARGGNDLDAPLPPGLDNPASAPHFAPVTIGESTGTAGDAPVAIGISAESGQLESISTDNPLLFDLTVNDESVAGLLAVAFDGELYYVVGRSAAPAASGVERSQMTVAVDYLPLPGAPDAPSARDVKRTVRLFLYKIFDRGLPADAGLRRVTLTDGQVNYTPVTQEELAAAHRIALIVHGFNSDTRRMAESLWPWLPAAGAYDLCLAYDYETFATPIRDNGFALANALQELSQLSPQPLRLDIFSHSAGGLVSRAAAELGGADAFIDRIYMTGVPNAGTPLAHGRSLLPWLADIFINLADSVPPVLIAHFLLDRLVASGRGIADLEPESLFLQELNATWRPAANVAYFVAHGDNSASQVDWRKLAARLMRVVDSGLDLLFLDDHDLAVSIESGFTLQRLRPTCTTARVTANHFQYYRAADARALLAEWFKQPA